MQPNLIRLQYFKAQVLQLRWFGTIISPCSKRLGTDCLWWKTIQEGMKYCNHQWKLDLIIAIKILIKADQRWTISETSALVGVNVWSVHTILSELINSRLLQDGFQLDKITVRKWFLVQSNCGWEFYNFSPDKIAWVVKW